VCSDELVAGGRVLAEERSPQLLGVDGGPELFRGGAPPPAGPGARVGVVGARPGLLSEERLAVAERPVGSEPVRAVREVGDDIAGG
jgi:hypothetical protein